VEGNANKALTSNRTNIRALEVREKRERTRTGSRGTWATILIRNFELKSVDWRKDAHLRWGLEEKKGKRWVIIEIGKEGERVR
jgi:hypothetical protein